VLRRPLPRPSPRLLAVAAVCALGAAVVPAYAAPASVPRTPAGSPAPGGDPCRDITVPVPATALGTAATAGDQDLTIFGRFCLPRGKAPQTALLALHGITYTSE
jgi:hypothetical protein